MSIWRLDKDRQRNGSHKKLIVSYDPRRDQFDAGEVLDAQELPRHFAALLRRRVLAVSAQSSADDVVQREGEGPCCAQRAPRRKG